MKMEKILEHTKVDASLLSTYKKELMGVAAITIMFMHGANYFDGFGLNAVQLFEKVMIQLGVSGVDIFLFLAGLGSYYSLSRSEFVKRGGYLTYLGKRLKSMLIPFWIIVIPGWLIIGCSGIKEFLLHISTLYFWVEGNDGTWFVSFILAFYIIFPVLYVFFERIADNRKKVLYVLGILAFTVAVSVYIYLFCGELSEKIGIGLYRIPSLIIGMIFGYLAYGKKEVSLLWLIPVFAVVVGRQVFHFPDSGLAYYWPNICKSILYMSLYVAAFNLMNRFNLSKWIPRIFGFVGSISLEVYLIHMMLLIFIGEAGVKDIAYSGIIWYGIMVVSILMAKLIALVKNLMTKKITESIGKKKESIRMRF